MRILALLVVGIAITFTACSKKETNVVGSDSNPLETKLTKEATDSVALKGEGKYEKIITKPLVKTDDCKYIVEGTIEVLLDGETVAIIDYGDGECDNIATKTVDGKTYEFELDNKKRDEKDSGKGDGKGKGKDDKGDYTKNIIKPIVKLEGCDFPVEGTIEYLKDGKVIATIDYGDGECDNIATKTVDGKTYEFELNNKKADKKDFDKGGGKSKGKDGKG